MFRLAFSGCLSSMTTDRQSELFTTEQKRQRELVGRIEKIEVTCVGPNGTDETVLAMNKNLSTPYDCSKRTYKLIWINRKFTVKFVELNGSLSCFCPLFQRVWLILQSNVGDLTGQGS